MLHMPRILILHDLGLALPEDLEQEGGHVRFVPELGHGREERFEIEDYGAREREAAEGLPVYAQVDAGEGEGGGGELGFADGCKGGEGGLVVVMSMMT